MVKKTAEERFFERVRKDPETGCWLWTGRCDADGYGYFFYQGKARRAHRWVYMMFVGDPGDLLVCHACDVRHCVNPKHLWLGTDADNARDASIKGRLHSGDGHHSRINPERLARGERHGSRTKPDSLPRGDQHYSRTQPDRLARGDRHRARLHPETMPRGEDHGMAKLNWVSVRQIRERYAKGGVTYRQLGSEYGVTLHAIFRVVKRKVWIE